LGPTAYGGAFLLLRPAVRLYRLAATCFHRLGADKGPRLVLSLFFKAVLGIPRIFHFETLHDVGFALLTGGTSVLSRDQVGGLVRAVSQQAVRSFLRKTERPVRWVTHLWVSLDDHAIARFTRKFAIKKGYHTIRNKHMKIEKIFVPYLTHMRMLAPLWATRGNGRLTDFALRVLPGLRRRARGAPIGILCDAAAAKDTKELLRLVEVNKRGVLIVRVPRRPAYRKAWAALPKDMWTQRQEAGPYKDAPPKVIHIAETKTKLTVSEKGTPRRTVLARTIVVREAAGRGKERWHALWIFGDDKMDPYQVVQTYRGRQPHEQTYRILLHDTYVDTAPSGYNKQSNNPRNPGFKQNALTLYAWIAALVYNTLEEFSQKLPKKFWHAHPRTLRRWFFQVPAELFLGHNSLIVLLRPRLLHGVWEELVRKANQHPVHIPWLADRRLLLSLDLAQQPLPPPSLAQQALALELAQQERSRKNQSFHRRAA
jgi:hypothetical protein